MYAIEEDYTDGLLTAYFFVVWCATGHCMTTKKKSC